jgi:hypothetical protein
MTTPQSRDRQALQADLIPDARVAERYGVSTRTIPRWDADPDLGFPAPVVINGRRYRRRVDLERFERAHIRSRATEAA